MQNAIFVWKNLGISLVWNKGQKKESFSPTPGEIIPGIFFPLKNLVRQNEGGGDFAEKVDQFENLFFEITNILFGKFQDRGREVELRPSKGPTGGFFTV